MRYPINKPTPVQSRTVILTGGVKEDASQLEVKPGTLVEGINYEEVDGVYHGYASISGYERFDGQPSPSSIGLLGLVDYGNDINTNLLLESDSASPILDISQKLHTITNTGVVNDLIQKKFLSSSYWFNGTSNLMVTPADTSLDLVDDNFTIEALVRPTAIGIEQVLFEKALSYKVVLNAAGTISFYWSLDGLAWEAPVTSTGVLIANSTQHVSVVRKSGRICIFISGSKSADDATISTDVIFTVAANLYVGSSFLGNMDEIRISNKYRWIFDFTVPTIPYSTGGYYWLQQDDEDREAARALIQEVPGAGPILAVLSNEGSVGACRNNLTATNSYFYRADPTGWSSAIPGVFYLYYENGTDTNSPTYPGMLAGEPLTGSISGATGVITDIIKQSGLWDDTAGGRDAAGIIVLKDVVGTFLNSDVLSNGVTATADVVYDSFKEYALSPDGSYRHVNAKFDAFLGFQRQSMPFIANGVNFPFYFDGTQLIPIIDDNLPDAQGIYATDVIEFKNRLILAYPDGQIWYSNVGDPLDWDTSTGAGTFYVKDEITGLIKAPGDSLIVFCRNSIQIIKTIVDSNMPAGLQSDYAFHNETFSDRSGALSHTPQRLLGEIYFMDDRGVTNLTTTDAFGDFGMNSISKNVQRTLLAKKDDIVGTQLNREKNQYRIFFGDETALCFTFNEQKKVRGVTSYKFNHTVSCLHSGEDTSGDEMLHFGSTDGFVYQMETGTSFDGDIIPTKIVTSFHSYGDNTQWKRFHKVTMEAQADKGLILKGNPEFNYRDNRIPRSNQTTYISNGYGGIWGSDAWGSFTWGASIVQSPVLYMTGFGTNMSLTVVTGDKYARPHILNSMIVEYSKHARKM